MDTIAANAITSLSKYNRPAGAGVADAVPLTKADLRSLNKWCVLIGMICHVVMYHDRLRVHNDASCLLHALVGQLASAYAGGAIQTTKSTCHVKISSCLS